MSVENRAEHQTHPGPPKELTQEMSLGTALRRLVDDLFTNQAIGERLRSLAGAPEVEALLETWKRDLTGQLEETARLSVENAAGIIDLLQSAGAIPSITSQERQEWAEIAAWYKPFTVASICREDLRRVLSEEEIGALDDTDMADIADRMSDAYRDSGGYWESLEIMARHVLQKREADAQPVPGERSEANAPSAPASPESDKQPPTEATPSDDPTPPPDKST